MRRPYQMCTGWRGTVDDPRKSLAEREPAPRWASRKAAASELPRDGPHDDAFFTAAAGDSLRRLPGTLRRLPEFGDAIAVAGAGRDASL